MILLLDLISLGGAARGVGCQLRGGDPEHCALHGAVFRIT
jgi:hypothetical protein